MRHVYNRVKEMILRWISFPFRFETGLNVFVDKGEAEDVKVLKNMLDRRSTNGDPQTFRRSLGKRGQLALPASILRTCTSTTLKCGWRRTSVGVPTW